MEKSDEEERNSRINGWENNGLRIGKERYEREEMMAYEETDRTVLDSTEESDEEERDSRIDGRENNGLRIRKQRYEQEELMAYEERKDMKTEKETIKLLDKLKKTRDGLALESAKRGTTIDTLIEKRRKRKLNQMETWVVPKKRRKLEHDWRKWIQYESGNARE